MVENEQVPKETTPHEINFNPHEQIRRYGRNPGMPCGLFPIKDSVIIEETMHAFVLLDQLRLKAVSACNTVKWYF